MHTPRISAAVFVSVLVHAVVASQAWIAVPAQIEESSLLQVRLVALAPPPPAARPDPIPRPFQPQATRRPATPTPAPQAAYVSPRPALPASTIVEDSADSVGEPVATVDAVPPPATEASATPAEQVAEPAATDPPNPLPSTGRLTYTLRLGTEGYPVGRSTYAWSVEGDTYRLVSDSETMGMADMFRPQRLTYTSEGRLTAAGLRPERFAMTRTRRGETTEATARLDWDAKRLTYGQAAHPRTVALPAASQDIVSFVLQFALNPPAQGRIRLPITNGTKFDTYEMEVLAEERVETPLGLFLALPLKQVRKRGAESIEVWLAVDYGYLPVKLRFLDRDGRQSGEQLVSAIQLSQQ